MRSAIFSIVSGIVLTLLLRGPAPAPPPPPPPSCAIPAAAHQTPADAIATQVVEALRDSLPASLARQQTPSAALVIVGLEGTVWHGPEISVPIGNLYADTCHRGDQLPAVFYTDNRDNPT